jgi:hypothetical protein
VPVCLEANSLGLKKLFLHFWVLFQRPVRPRHRTRPTTIVNDYNSEGIQKRANTLTPSLCFAIVHRCVDIQHPLHGAAAAEALLGGWRPPRQPSLSRSGLSSPWRIRRSHGLEVEGECFLTIVPVVT